MVGLLGAEGVPAAASGAGWFVEHAWLIALLPFISAALTLFFGKRTPGGGPVYGIAALGALPGTSSRVEGRTRSTWSGSGSDRSTCSSASTWTV